MKRASCAVALLMVLMAGMQPAGQAQTTDTSSDKSTCLQSYKSANYKSALPACQRLFPVYIAHLEAMAKSNDASVVLSSSLDLLRVNYVMAFGYRQNGAATEGRQMALHSVGWGILAMGAVKSIDPKGQTPKYNDMAEEIARDVRALDAAFPGVKDEARKIFEEQYH